MITIQDICDQAMTRDRLVFSYRVHDLTAKLLGEVKNSQLEGLSSEEMDRLIIQMLSVRLTLNS